jgi:L-ascorbate metabolism protein UlaG (beta-lactamase superfamily)
LAFLPINGVVAIYRGLDPSGLPATLTPKQACVATCLLRAAKLCPIHFGSFNNPPVYVEQPDLLNELSRASGEERIEVQLVAAGEVLFEG